MICLLIGHNDIEFNARNGISKECKRCGSIRHTPIKTVKEAVDYFNNYDKAIAYCLKNPETYLSNPVSEGEQYFTNQQSTKGDQNESN